MLSFEKTKKSLTVQTAEKSEDKSKSGEQSFDIDGLLGQAEEKKIKEMSQKFEKALGKYERPLKIDASKKEETWQALSNDFPDFTQGLKQGNIGALKIKAGLTINTGDVRIDNITDMEFVWVPTGCFQMGSDSDEASSDEKPVHEVCLVGRLQEIIYPYYIGFLFVFKA